MLQNQLLSLLNYITAAIAEGLAERQAAKDEEVEDTADDEKEKKAARLQAEAEAEGGRGDEAASGRGVVVGRPKTS